MRSTLKILVIFVVTLTLCDGSRVLELTDKFAEIRRDGGHWLVMFYAPWCGHCKRLEPIWGHIAQTLYKTNIRVAKIDCTRFTGLAKEFGINGFPTIKFFKVDQDFTYNGDRTKEDIVNFALRMSSPPVQEITRPDSFVNIKSSNNVFFLYVGQREGPLWESYVQNAVKLQQYAFFYATSFDVASQHVTIEGDPAAMVCKENSCYFYTVESDADLDHINSTLNKWINEERFETFPKITRGNIHEIFHTKKYVVIAIVEENKLQQISPEMLEFRDMVESVIRKNRDKYHKHFQFGWIGSPELANSIAMTVLPLPYLLVLNSTTNHHHIPEDEPTQLTVDALSIFLEQIYNQSVPAYGGNSFPVRLYRTYFEARTSIGDMWKGNPVLTTVLFGLPLGFLSLILYSICCQDILDADEEDEETEPLLQHEKKE
ncbi:hypothetical protein PPYR_10857 [Photinus pyralis]|uniref:Thioredoxin domain-containing protein n=1 Tax=Photinus pyralis TaxID=7054 RepID=A0A1Y1NG91_PHOPY|nr:protein disulfide-isomerase TMX3 [Photinus pyralis]XP_031347702.1 protein disulfide-isomerase TMX3 [Photinus pyralis]KAB0796796.1 hypothetical protein PPYR_10857 [Photinus pyralis]